MKNNGTFNSLPTYGQIESGLFHKPVAKVENMSGCEFMKCKYYIDKKCTDPNEWVNDNGDAVCGLRSDAILNEENNIVSRK